MQVAELWRFPVKSMQGAPVESVAVDESGTRGDREWGVVDPAAGRVLSAKRWPPLLQARAARDDATGAVVVTLPDGTEHEAGDPKTDAALSSWLDHPVELRRSDPAAAALPFEMYTDPTDDESATFEFAGPPQRWVDLAAIHVVTTASLRAAAALYPDGAWDVRRFRPVALIDAAGDGFVEDDWIGQEVTLGAVTIAPFMPTVRCSMTTRAQPELPRDVGIAKTLNQHHGLNLGVYANVIGSGTIRVGDPVSIA